MVRESIRRIGAQFGHRYWAEKARGGGRPDELWQAVGAAGFIGANLPEAFGGGGLGIAATAIVCEELAAAGCPLLLLVVSPSICGTVLARFGNAGRAFHDLARGLDTGPPVLVAPPPDLVEQVELDPPTARVDVAAFAAKGLADRLLMRLAERGLACTRVVIEAETEHGERMARTWRHDGALTPGALGERVRWQLDGWLTATNAPKVMEGDVRAAQDAAAFADAGFDSTTGALLSDVSQASSEGIVEAIASTFKQTKDRRGKARGEARADSRGHGEGKGGGGHHRSCGRWWI